MLYIYLSCSILLVLIVIFYYKFTQNKKEQESRLKSLTESNNAYKTELKDFQQFVLNGFQHLSKEIESSSDDETMDENKGTEEVHVEEPIAKPEVDSNNVVVNEELSNDLKEKINNLNSDIDNEFDLEVQDVEALDNNSDRDGQVQDYTEVAEEVDEVEVEVEVEVEEVEESGDEVEEVEESGDEVEEVEESGEDVEEVEESGDDVVEVEESGEDVEESDEDSIQINNPQLELLSMKELQTIARDNNLAIRGPKKDLIERIKNNTD